MAAEQSHNVFLLILLALLHCSRLVIGRNILLWKRVWQVRTDVGAGQPWASLSVALRVFVILWIKVRCLVSFSVARNFSVCPLGVPVLLVAVMIVLQLGSIFCLRHESTSLHNCPMSA